VPPHLASATAWVKTALLREESLPPSKLIFSPGIKDNLHVIDIFVPDADLQAQVLTAVERLPGALPFNDGSQVNFKAARVRVSVQENGKPA
jgi:hypothetical protein